MTPPIDPAALQRVLASLPPEDADPFPHLANLSPDALLRRRSKIADAVNSLEQERKATDAELVEMFSSAELRCGVRAPGGWVLQQRQAQRDGRAQPRVSTYLCLTDHRSNADAEISQSRSSSLPKHPVP